MKGSEFVRQVTSLSRPDRETAILNAAAAQQHLPIEWVEIPFTVPGPDGKARSGCFRVASDYFSIGTPDDFVRVPMSLPTALEVGDLLAGLLPTTRMVDLVWQHAAIKLAPQPMTPPRFPYDASMLSVDRFVTHNRMIEQQRKGRAGLVRGHKKDLVVTTRMAKEPGKVAIYGWQDPKTGKPIQPLSLKHEASYADYSHGIGFVHTRMTLDGVDMALIDFLADPALAPALSDEGPITVVPSAGVPPADTPPPPGPAAPIDYTLPLGERCVAWELAELRAGPRPSDARIEWYFSGCVRYEQSTGFEAPLTGLGPKDNWCAASACAATHACQMEGEPPPFKGYAYRASGEEMISDARNGGAWHEAAEVKAGKWRPRKGDLAIFQREGWHRHVARIDVPPDDKGTYCTIGGNEGPSPGEWKRTERSFADADLLGFVAFPRPATAATQPARPIPAPPVTTNPTAAPTPPATPAPTPPAAITPPAPVTPPVTTTPPATPPPPATTTIATTTPPATTPTTAPTTGPAPEKPPPRHAPPPPETMGSFRLTLTLLGLMALMLAIALAPHLPGGLAWGIEIALMCGFLATVGYATCGQALGVLINGQRVVSVSRFQAVLWTVIVLSAYFTMVMRRIHDPDPLAVGVDEHLWMLMGISTASLVGTPLLQGRKKEHEPEEGSFDTTAAMLDQAPEDVDADRHGLMYVNPSMDDARLSDMFGGDEVGNAAYVDLGKVQMFFFTMVSALIYGVMIYEALEKGAGRFPTLTPGLLGVLGLSHLGHLGAAATKATPVRDDSAAPSAPAAADPSVQKILEVVGRIDRTTHDEAQTSKKILAAVSPGSKAA